MGQAVRNFLKQARDLRCSEVGRVLLGERRKWLGDEETEEYKMLGVEVASNSLSWTIYPTTKENGSSRQQELKEDVQMASGYMTRCSASLITRERQGITTVRYQLTSGRTMIIRKTKDSKCWQGTGEKGTVCGNVNWNNHCISLAVSQETENRTTMWSSNFSLLGSYSKETKSLSWRDICTPMFTAILSTIAKREKQPKMYFRLS